LKVVANGLAGHTRTGFRKNPGIMDTAARLSRQTYVPVMTQNRIPSLEERARRGEAAAFGSLIRDFDHDLRGVVWSVVQSVHATDDVMQSAYEKAFASIRSFNGRSALKTWLHSICYRTAIDYVRYENRRRHEDVDDVERGAFTSRLTVVADSTSAVDDRLDLDERLSALAPEERALLMLTIGLGYTFDETAVIVGMKRGTVASKTSRARTRLNNEATQ